MLKKTSDSYECLMKEIKQMNSAYKKITSSKGYKIIDIIGKIIRHEVDFTYVKIRFNNLCAEIKCKFTIKNTSANNIESRKCVSNYYFPHRIAVYTCLVGNYDRIQDPFVVPDNCDFYIYCEKDYKVDSVIWKKRDVDEALGGNEGLSAVEKSRFIKMFPHILFPEYEYSFYIDSCIKIMTDISEYMHDIGFVGMALHRHSRGCVYKEAKTVMYYHKAPMYAIKQYVAFLRNNGMPEDYGLLACGVMARQHHNPLCIKIMEEWWKMYLENVQRDQLLLPYVLFKCGIDIGTVATMPGTVYENESFLFFEHIK